MQEPKAIAAFLKAANLTNVANKTKISRPTLYRMRKEDFSSVQYTSMKAVSDFMDEIFETSSEA